MPDPIFADPRLAAVYDDLDPDRSDLDVYAALVGELRATSVLDVGCGTGTFACMLARRGVRVVGLDPAEASLAVAATKPGADRVRWLLGEARSLPSIAADAGVELGLDLATMTGNVAQVFLTDEAFAATLAAIRAALAPGGHLVFEVRDPARRAWRSWIRAKTWRKVSVPEVGVVETWLDLVEESPPFVSFRATYRFEPPVPAAGATSVAEVLTSDSTLRFRERSEVETALAAAGLEVAEVRDAPDRPGLEHVFIALRPST